MKLTLEKQAFILKLLDTNQGVLSIAELKILLRPKNQQQFYRDIQVLERSRVLQPFCRGVYVSQQPNLKIVSQRIQPNSYLSLGSALSQHLIIGSVPSKTVYAIKVGKSRKYQSSFGEIIHLGITPDLFFGFEMKDGICVANKEKAFLDTLYYYQKGQKYSFNIFSDFNLKLLDRSLLAKYLRKYRNPKFVSFAKGLMSAD